MRLIFLLILSLFAFTSCNKDVAIPIDGEDIDNDIYDLELIDSKLLDISEPSGLSWALNQKDLIVVDDNTNKAFVIDIKGKVISEFPYIGDDTEGITIDKSNNEIWIAEEAESELIQLDHMGNKLQSYKIDIDRDSYKSGLEGLTYDSNNKIFYILNEAEPGLLIKWQINGGIISETQLQFAQDYSGIFYDNVDQSLWILSDQSQELYYCDLNANVKQTFKLDYTKAEGIVIDPTNGLLYIVSDSEQRLYIYKITKL